MNTVKPASLFKRDLRVMSKTRDLLVNFKSNWDISSNFVAFLDYSNDIAKFPMKSFIFQFQDRQTNFVDNLGRRYEKKL